MLFYPNLNSAAEKSRKLALRWRGPFQVLKRIPGSPNIYAVGDHNNKNIQVVNVRRMRKWYRLPAELAPPTEEASRSEQDSKRREPNDQTSYDVDCLMGKKKWKNTTYYLVRWSNDNGNTYDPTWEPEHLIDKQLVEHYESLHKHFRR